MARAAWARQTPSKRYGSRWKKLRLRILDRDYWLCQCTYCKAEGRTALATEVDHIISVAIATTQGWSIAQQDDPSNLQSINRECHVRKTIEEMGGVQKPKRNIGADGFPINNERGMTP